MTEQAYSRIPLRRTDGSVRAYAVVDPEDFEQFGSFRWCLTGGYAVRSVWRDGKPFGLILHREILGLSRGDGHIVDHINRDKLDNRKVNLRVLTPEASLQNTSSRARSSSRYRGVRRSRSGRWEARAQMDKKFHYIGTFDLEIDAAKASARWRRDNMPFAVEDHPELLD